MRMNVWNMLTIKQKEQLINNLRIKYLKNKQYL